MRWKQLLLLTVLCVGLIGSSSAIADTTRGFGFGTAMAMAFFPDMAGVNAFMSENGLPSMGEFLVGAGGTGRGGVIGGSVFGGGGWGLLAFSESDALSAELVSAGGGFDIGRAIGGNARSILTLGAVLGGGANVLSVTGYLVQTIEPEGLVPEPTYREIGRAIGFVQPYVSMAAQLLPWMGFELRIGYLFPVLGFEFGDLLGIPAPSLELSGPTLSFGFAFGGIGSGQASPPGEVAASDKKVTTFSEGSFEIDRTQELHIENALGDIIISSYAPNAAQTAPSRVEWQATRTAKPQQMDELQVIVDLGETSATLRTKGSGQIDYMLRVPQGIDLRVENGVGTITVNGHEALTVIIENGVGDIQLESVNASALILSGGVGKMALSQVTAATLIADLGIGEIDLGLPVTASARIMAKAGLGEVTIDRFPGMTGGVRGFLGSSGNVTLGIGERMIELRVALGRVSIEMDEI